MRAFHENPDRIYTLNSHLLALKAHFIIKSHAYAFVEIFEASSTNSVDPDLTAPVGAVRSRSTLFASILMSKLVVILLAFLIICFVSLLTCYGARLYSNFRINHASFSALTCVLGRSVLIKHS